jgi:argininosuccinate synthase
MATAVLAYSGGLDTSVAIRWIKEKYDLDVIALTIDVGNERDMEAISARAKKIGAVKALVVDGRILSAILSGPRFKQEPSTRVSILWQPLWLAP